MFVYLFACSFLLVLLFFRLRFAIYVNFRMSQTQSEVESFHFGFCGNRLPSTLNGASGDVLDCLFALFVQDGSTALMAAACSGHLDIVKLLLASGAKKNKRDNVTWGEGYRFRSYTCWLALSWF